MSSKKVVSKKVVSPKKVVAPVKTVKKPVAKKAEKIVAPVKKAPALKFENPKTDVVYGWAVIAKKYNKLDTSDGIIAVMQSRQDACEFSKLQKGKTVTKKIKVVASII